MIPVILASGSPRRRALLQQIQLPFTVITPDVDESAGPMPPDALVHLLSRRKAEAVATGHPDRIVIAADTVVALDGLILGKPLDAGDARRMLALLSGRTHAVYTGFTVRQGNRVQTRVVRTLVTFRPLSEREIDCYVATGEPLDKAGAYGIQGLGGLLIDRLEGDYYNVIGLPLCPLGQVLTEFGISTLGGGCA